MLPTRALGFWLNIEGKIKSVCVYFAWCEYGDFPGLEKQDTLCRYWQGSWAQGTLPNCGGGLTPAQGCGRKVCQGINLGCWQAQLLLGEANNSSEMAFIRWEYFSNTEWSKANFRFKMGRIRKYLHAKESSPLDRAKSCWGYCAWELLGISFGLLVPLLHPGSWQQQEERERVHGSDSLGFVLFVCLFVYCLMTPFHCPVLAWACLFCSRQPGRFSCVPPWVLPAGENQVWEQRSLVTALAKRSMY